MADTDADKKRAEDRAQAIDITVLDALQRYLKPNNLAEMASKSIKEKAHRLLNLIVVATRDNNLIPRNEVEPIVGAWKKLMVERGGDKDDEGNKVAKFIDKISVDPAKATINSMDPLEPKAKDLGYVSVRWHYFRNYRSIGNIKTTIKSAAEAEDVRLLQPGGPKLAPTVYAIATGVSQTPPPQSENIGPGTLPPKPATAASAASAVQR